MEKEKECCEIKVTELDRGYCIEVTGEQVKDMLGECMKRCMPGGGIKWSWPSEGKGCC